MDGAHELARTGAEHARDVVEPPEMRANPACAKPIAMARKRIT
jgi:hypothetical protein